MQIKGNTFIITGGLGGLGGECATSILRQGGNVGVFDIVDQSTGDTKTKEKFDSPNAIYVQVDICDKEQSAAAVDKVLQKFGNLKGLIHCAGVALRRNWVDNNLSDSIDLFRKTIEVNAVGTFTINAAVGDAINRVTVKELGIKPKEGSRFWTVDQERGIIINFASIAGHSPNARIVGYGPSKTCVLGLTQSIADFYGPSGIRVNSISPGIVATAMAGAHIGWFQHDLNANAIFPKRPARPEHISHAVNTLIENEFINAEDIKVTGGWKLVTTTHPGAGDPRDAAPGLE
ncbi:unnamed protein product [Sympodiomycopsis kandeliae]